MPKTCSQKTNHVSVSFISLQNLLTAISLRALLHILVNFVHLLVDTYLMIGKQNRNFMENEVIFLEGDVGDCAYLIEYGQVLVFLMKDGKEIPLKTLGKGEIFGEMSIIDSSARSASCRALTELRLVVVTQEQLLDRIHAADPVVRLLMRALLERLREQNDNIRGIITNSNSVISAALEKEKKEALDRIALENNIANGLERGEFVPYYQPIYDLNTQKIKGCEALIRWIKPDGKIISPAVFVDVLEQSSLIIPVGKMMIEKCIADLAQMHSQISLSEDFFVSINISGRQFSDLQFLDHLETVRSKANISAKHIKLEVTERIMTEGPLAISTLQNCRALGFQIAIDDFGTGFSSLQYLASMPLNDLKIDRNFVSQMMTSEKSLSIVKTLIYMSNLLNLNLIAEGIETKAELFLLKNLGVSLGQGYLFAKAMPYSEFMMLASERAEDIAA